MNKYFVYAKGRNIIYYRELDLGVRPRATYLHILRLFRKEVSQIIKDLPSTDPYFNLFLDIVNQIPEKPKNIECDSLILKLKSIYDNRRIEESIAGE